MSRSAFVSLVCGLLVGWSRSALAEPTDFRIERGAERLIVRLGERPIATYVFSDAKISRPYLCDLFTNGGLRVTRRHPPVAGEDLTDHDTFHPGMWLAFGDLGGEDYWRLKAPVEHAGFVRAPVGGASAGFTVRNKYRRATGDGVVCQETCRYVWLPHEAGYVLTIDSEFSNDEAEFAFGDQEEMGLGIRMATPLIVERGGQIVNSRGQRNEKQAWGQTAAWCDYSGVIGDRRVAVTLIPAASNFRPAWFHVRDYGLMAANPFGRHALAGGEPSRVAVARGERFRLGYALLVRELPAAADPDTTDAVSAVLKQIASEPMDN
jgi:hypothetical protein